ncbi:methionyl-tRNA formyltransferase [Aureisphaera galaxeae]|uniref:methionyl-tRNA formyltransferase n=1 Tax=Aureisphaera galaxeae TaxID=1538023 RepID=UPI002350DF6D|nr:methionyl-tRNA formyltransferase [Aureisphaera galaxeae]MDC8003792.1 methionyl-tRNA formyltransferase [Aureisphaera galaxeae]
MRALRIVFMGTPHFAVGVLQTIIENGHKVVGIITAPDKPAGRGRKLRQSAVKEYALSQGLPVLQPTNLKAPEFLDELKALEANLQVVVAFRMLPKVVWDLPEFGTFNLHASLLPEYRGAAPINWAVINAEQETGVTTFFIDEKIDTGAIIASEKVAIDPRETAGSLHDKLMETGSQLVVHTLDMIANDKATPQPQDKNLEFKEAPKLTSENTQIDWSLSLESIDAFIRGLSPYPSAWAVLINKDKEMKVKIYGSEIEPESHSHTLGSIFTEKRKLKVAVEGGYLHITEMQIPGKRKMDIGDLLNGFEVEKGAYFS